MRRWRGTWATDMLTDDEDDEKGDGECVSLWTVSTVYDEGQANEDEFEWV